MKLGRNIFGVGVMTGISRIFGFMPQRNPRIQPNLYC